MVSKMIGRAAAAFLAVGLWAAAASPAEAHGRVTLGFSIGVPVYRPYPYGYAYYRPYPLYVAPPPVVLQPAPVYLSPAPVIYQQPAPVVVAPPAAPPVYQAPAPAPYPTAATQPASATYASQQEDAIGRNLQLLMNADERVRGDAAMDLGRMRATRAIDRLAAVLASDPSPSVRDSAARALGLIGERGALPALQRAAQMDNDRDVRRSAQFAVEVITANLRRN